MIDLSCKTMQNWSCEIKDLSLQGLSGFFLLFCNKLVVLELCWNQNIWIVELGHLYRNVWYNVLNLK